MALDPAQEARVLALAERAGTSNILTISAKDEPIVKAEILRAEKDIVVSRSKIPNPPYLGAQIAHLQRLKVAIAPHKKLPPEVWREVFLSFTDSETPPYFTASEGFLGSSSVREYIPWTLRQVCSPWRELVLNHASFWNRLLVEVPLITQVRSTKSPESDDPDGEPSSNQEEERSRLLVQRWETIKSRVENLMPADGPLHIGIVGPWGWHHIYRRGLDSGDSLLCTHLGVEFLQQHGPRIVNLNIRDCSETDIERLLTVESTAFSSLERLSIDYGHCGEAMVLRNTSIFRASPHLRYLAIHSQNRNVEILLRSPLPWAQLTRLSLSQWPHETVFPGQPTQTIPSSHVLRILSPAQNLTSLTLKLDLSAGAGEAPTVTLPILRFLHLASGNMAILDWLRLPSLRRLELFHSRKGENIYDVVNYVNNLIQRSGCNLEVFKEAPCDRKFHGFPYDQHRPEFEHLLYELLRNVKEVDTNGIILGTPEVERVGRSDLFPHARSIAFSCDIPSEQVLQILGPRLTTEDARLRLDRLRAKSETGSASNKRAKEIMATYREKYNITVDVCYEAMKEQTKEEAMMPDHFRRFQNFSP